MKPLVEMPKMRARSVAVVIALVATMLVPGSASAQPATGAPPPTADAVKRADAMYKQGVRLYSEKRWAEAESAFREAWSLNPTFDVAYNLGSTEYQLGKFRDAAEHLAFAVRGWPLLKATASLRETAQQRLDACRAEVGAITIKVNVPRADVLLDGKPVGQAPIDGELFVAPGTHSLEARSAGYQSAVRTVQATRGAAVPVSLELSEEPAASAAPLEPMPAPKRSIVPAVVLGAGGAAFLAGGVAFAVVSNSKASSADAKLAELQATYGKAPCLAAKAATECTTLQDLNKSSDMFHNLAVAGFVVAGAATAAAVTYALWPAKPQSRVGLRVMPLFSAGARGLVVTGEL